MSETARQSTARDFIVGPILDADGVAVTNAVIADLKISKNGAAPAAFDGSATLTHRHTGFYSLGATATDLNTVGSGTVTIDDTVNCMPPLHITIVEEEVYDDIFAASAVGYLKPATAGRDLVVDAAGLADANTVKIGPTGSGTAQTAKDLGAIDVNADGSVKSGNGTEVWSSTNPVPANATQVEGTDATTYFDTLDDAVLTAIAALNDPSAAEIADAVWDEATAGHTTSGTFGEQVKTDIDLILADSNELQQDWTNGGRLDLLIDAILDDTGTSGVALSAASIIRASGCVHVDSDAVSNGDGTPNNPTNSIANGKTVADANGVETLILHGAATHTLAATLEGYLLKSFDLGVTLNLNGQQVANEYENLHVTGTAATTNTEHNHFRDCDLEDIGFPDFTHSLNCRPTGTLTIQPGTVVEFAEGISLASPTFSFDAVSASPAQLVIANCFGNYNIDNLNANGSRGDVLYLDGGGRFVFQSGCNGGLLRVSNAPIYDTSAATGQPTLTESNIKDVADLILSRMGTPSNFGSGATLAFNLFDIEAQTDDIGAAGAGLTALGDARLANLDATVSSRASQTSVNTIDDLLDTEIASIMTDLSTLLTNLATVDSNVDAILLDTGTDGVVVASLAAAAVDSIWDDAIVEPTGMFAWASATPRKGMQTLMTLMRNEIDSDGNSVDVRNDADTLTLWSYPSSDDGTTFISGEAA